MTEQKIAYETHPVSAARKAELRQQGYKIIDARFKPAEHEAGDGMTIEQARDELDALGIEYGPRQQLPGLLKLLAEYGAGEPGDQE